MDAVMEPLPPFSEVHPRLSRAKQSRVNGARSRGPKTPEGKAVSARNATRHGFSSPNAIVLEGEDPQAFNQVQQDLLNAWAPDCPDGCQLVRRLAVAYLHRDRADRMQVALFATGADGMLKDPRQFELMQRYANAADRAIRRWREALVELRRRPLQGLLLTGDLAEVIPFDGTGEGVAPQEEILRNEPDTVPEAGQGAAGPVPEMPPNEPEARGFAGVSPASAPVPGGAGAVPERRRNEPDEPAAAANSNIPSPAELARWHAEIDLAERDGRTQDATRLLCAYLRLVRPQQQCGQRPPGSGAAPGQRPGAGPFSAGIRARPGSAGTGPGPAR